jgi:hypothetical protein
MAKRKSLDEVLADFRSVHGDIYDYSLVEYTNSSTSIAIICKQHGEFTQQPRAHFAGQGCPKCTQSPNWTYGKNTIAGFISRARSVHGDIYNYSATIYRDVMSTITIICPVHGKFTQRANSHLNGRGCPYCANNIKKSTQQFITDAKLVHGDAYDYSMVSYHKATAPITIICKTHGEFTQLPRSHLAGEGCYACGIAAMKQRLTATTTEFIDKAKKVYGDTYDYGRLEYRGRETTVTIICRTHGDFQQRPGDHINGHHGCPQCAGNQLKTTEQFIAEAIDTHGDRYDYNTTTYINSRTDLTITCKNHGDFTITPHEHILGRGCPTCNLSSGQLSMLTFLRGLDVKPIINDRTVIKPLEIDLYVADQMVGIEHHGSYWHSYDRPETSTERHRHVNKADLAGTAGIKLLQFYDYEWQTHRQIVESMIKAKLGLVTTRIAARSCTLVELTHKAAADFFTTNHLQGHRQATITYALVNASGPICALSLARHSKHGWEIIRFASRLNSICNGGCSRLFGTFQATPQSGPSNDLRR